MTLLDGLKNFLTREPCPAAAFQLTVTGLAGLHLSRRDHRAGRHVVLSLRPGSLEPSFDRPNIKDFSHLADRVQEAIRKLGLREHNVSLLVPESCLKTIILTFDDLPSSPAERKELVLWRLRKQMPSLPEDVRVSFDVIGAVRPSRVFISAIHPETLAEYEGLFARQGVRVRNVSLATLGLSNLLNLKDKASGILANIEEDCLSMLAVLDGEAAFYRSKPFLADSRDSRSVVRRMENAAREILNTMTFLEDREKKRVETLWLRTALADGEDDPLAVLKPLVPLNVQTIEASGFAGLRPKESRALAPLVGQLA
jgi:hypothetical protein